MHTPLQDLPALAHDRTHAGRHALFDRVAALVVDGFGDLPAGASLLIDQILTGLLHQVEADMRKQLSCRIALLADAPPGLIRALANDEVQIAEPILAHSPVLSARDLLDIIEARSAGHREIIARRAGLPAEIMTALLRLKEPQVIHALVSNAGAVIPRTVFNDLVAIAQGMEQIRLPLLGRADMPKDLAYQMFWYVSAAMRHSILRQYPIDPNELDGILAALVAERGMSRVRPLPSQSSWLSGEVRVLVARARAGDLEGFTQSLALVTGVDMAMARRIVADIGGEPLAIACKALGADRIEFTSIIVQMDKLLNRAVRPPAFLSDVARAYDTTSQSRAQAMLRLWSLQAA